MKVTVKRNEEESRYDFLVQYFEGKGFGFYISDDWLTEEKLPRLMELYAGHTEEIASMYALMSIEELQNEKEDSSEDSQSDGDAT